MQVAQLEVEWSHLITLLFSLTSLGLVLFSDTAGPGFCPKLAISVSPVGQVIGMNTESPTIFCCDTPPLAKLGGEAIAVLPEELLLPIARVALLLL